MSTSCVYLSTASPLANNRSTSCKCLTSSSMPPMQTRSTFTIVISLTRTHFSMSVNQSIYQSISLYFRQKPIEQQRKRKHGKSDRTDTDTQKNTRNNYRTKNHSLQNTQRESLQSDYEHAKSLTKRTSLLEYVC